MAYENYSFVSWSDGTPLTGERLAQMSMNMEQIRDANDRKPSGILQLVQSTTSGLVANVVATNSLVIQLTNPNGGSDQRITIPADRYYRVTCVFPGFEILNKGAEDSVLSLKIYQVASGFDAASPIMQWDMTPPPHAFYNVTSNANILASEQSYKSQTTTIGAGTYSAVATSGGGLSQQSFSVVVKRTFVSGATNAPTVSVGATAIKKLQLFVEDIGAGS
jgi:hypothetical protein